MFIKKFDFKRCRDWFYNGLEIYKKSPVLWSGILIAYWIINIIAKSIPGIGFLISGIISNFLLIGLMNGCIELENKNDLTFEHLFSGFTKNIQSIIAVSIIESSIILIAIIMAIVGVAAVVGPTLLISLFNSKSTDFNHFFNIFDQVNLTVLFSVLFISASFVVIVAFIVTSFMYAPYLVFYKNQKALEALKNSFNATMMNMMPLTLLGCIYLGILVLCIFTLGLGIFIAGPMMFCSFYSSYKDIFEVEIISSPSPEL